MRNDDLTQTRTMDRIYPTIAPQTSTVGFAAPKLKMAAEGLNAYFGKTHALKDVTLSIPEHQVMAIIGPSGCGKSTFLRSLNRMHEVAGGTMTGKISLDGESIFGLAWTRSKSAGEWGWSSRSPIPSRPCPSSTTWQPD
jgi:ABC-type multidrug transport system fused ATPase/permease subunit